jgi:hypothetical protein
MAEVDVITAQIASGSAVSAEIDIGSGKSLVGLVIPANWTTTGLSFQASPDGGATWAELTTLGGTPYAIGSLTGGTLEQHPSLDCISAAKTSRACRGAAFITGALKTSRERVAAQS